MSYTLPRGYLSPSSINRYITCPECFRLEYVDQAPRALGSSLFVGGAVHKAIEYVREAMLREEEYGGLLEDVAIQVAADHFNKEADEAEDIDLGGYRHIGKVKDHALELVRFALPELVRLDEARGLLAAELHLVSSLDLAVGEDHFFKADVFPFPFKARLDAVYGDLDTRQPRMIADTKTASKQQKPEFSTALQLWMYKEAFGNVIAMADVIAKTKEPSLHSYSLGAYSPEVMMALVTDVAEGISAGRFPPRPGFLCSYDHGLPKFSIVVEDVEDVA